MGTSGLILSVLGTRGHRSPVTSHLSDHGRSHGPALAGPGSPFTSEAIGIQQHTCYDDHSPMSHACRTATSPCLRGHHNWGGKWRWLMADVIIGTIVIFGRPRGAAWLLIAPAGRTAERPGRFALIRKRLWPLIFPLPYYTASSLSLTPAQTDNRLQQAGAKHGAKLHSSNLSPQGTSVIYFLDCVNESHDAAMPKGVGLT